MNYRRFGRTDWNISEVGYGMWGMGGWTGSDDDESSAALDRAVELGCNFFDTARVYGEGRSERLLGKMIRRHPDKKLYVTTKIIPKNREWPSTSDMKLDDVFPPDHVDRSMDQSLAALDVPRVDLIQFHVWQDEWTNDPRWLLSVENLLASGRAEAVGISINKWEPTNVVRALRTGLIDSVQVVYNIFDQNPEDELFPVCEELDVAVIARVPFDEGTLTDALKLDTKFPVGDWRNVYLTPEYLAESLGRIHQFRSLIPEGMSLPEFALRFILSAPTVCTVIPGMRKVKHVESNCAASDGRGLPAEVVRRLQQHRWVR